MYSFALSHTHYNQDIPLEIQQFFKEVSKTVSKNIKKQTKYFNLLHELYNSFEPVIKHLSENTEKITSVMDIFRNNLISLTKNLPKRTAAALLFTTFIGQVEAQNNLSVHAGQAPGGIDLCSGMIKCIQGFITDSNNKDFLVSFNSFVDLANSKMSAGAFWAYNDCMTIDNIGNLIKNILAQNTTLDVTSSCMANFHKGGASISGQVEKLALEQCMSFQNAFGAQTQRCLGDGKVMSLDGAIAGIIIGIVLICACSIGLSYYACKKCAK